LARIYYHLIKHGEAYTEYGADAYEKREKERIVASPEEHQLRRLPVDRGPSCRASDSMEFERKFLERAGAAESVDPSAAVAPAR
jgi:hypothetical protein